jgi:cytochrome P450
VQIGNIFVPKGLVLETSVHEIHQDPKLWGADAFEFNPNRFIYGVSKACQHPQGYLPFSFGPRFCIGHNFANTKLKVLLAMVLSKFQFLVFQNFRHCLIFTITQRPFYGVELIEGSFETPIS